MSIDREGVCPEENKPQSDSPFGAVRGGELLARVVSPSEVSKGRVQRSALMIKDLTERDGWSFVRHSHATDMESVINRVKGGAPDCRCATVKTSDVRGISNEREHQALCVIDNAQEGFPEHALAKRSVEYKPADAREIRNQLLELFNNVGQ